MSTKAFTYIMSSVNGTTLYTGFTQDIISRVIQHKQKHNPKSFTAKYNCIKLVWFEEHESIDDAFTKERYLKGKSRKFKDKLISENNFECIDLWENIKDW